MIHNGLTHVEEPGKKGFVAASFGDRCKAAGYKGYDNQAKPLTRDEIARERERAKEMVKEQVIRLSMRSAEKILRSAPRSSTFDGRWSVTNAKSDFGLGTSVGNSARGSASRS
mgnify:CR=1 FL=1